MYRIALDEQFYLYICGLAKAGQLGLGYANATGCQCVPSFPAARVMTGVAAAHRSVVV